METIIYDAAFDDYYHNKQLVTNLELLISQLMSKDAVLTIQIIQSAKL